jgi:hypothetical protein
VTNANDSMSDPHASDLPADIIIVDLDSSTADVYSPDVADADSTWASDYTSGAFDDLPD